jgi:hypothetical protein
MSGRQAADRARVAGRSAAETRRAGHHLVVVAAGLRKRSASLRDHYASESRA